MPARVLRRPGGTTPRQLRFWSTAASPQRLLPPSPLAGMPARVLRRPGGTTTRQLRFRSTAAPPLPPSPLAGLVDDTAAIRTGYTHLFSRAEGVDRTAAQIFRAACRSGEYVGQTSGRLPGFVQANFVCLPEEHAFAFLAFALRNPRACPLLEVTEPGNPCPRAVAPSADLRTDLPKYRVWRNGEMLTEPTDIRDLWGARMVGFLLGCSFSWKAKLAQANLTPRNVALGCNVPMYRTSIPNARSGPFGGELVVSMRPYRPDQLAAVAAITARYPGAHGGPVHWGDPAAIGIPEGKLVEPDWGDCVEVRPGEVPVFWACGVTPHAALLRARLPLAITHAPGHMLVTDLLDAELEVPSGAATTSSIGFTSVLAE